MEGGKPLIFIKPYTKTLQKLKEVLEESSEQQGTEIYEIEDLQEAIQLIPQIGQSLVIAAHPRKTAMLLQASRQHIKKLQTKVLLISPKPIPRKTVDKFMKVGLTECIVEPIVPKTLQYKVNLLIRSMAQKKEETSFEKKFDSDVAEQASDIEVKEMQKKQKEILEEALEDAKKSQKEVEFDDDLYGQKKTFKENPIEGFYKGKNRKTEDAQDDNEDDSPKKNENVIEGFYKGSLKQTESVDETEDEKQSHESDEEQDDIQALAKRVNLLLDDEEDGQEKDKSQATDEQVLGKKKSTSLDIEDEEIHKKAKEALEKDESLDDVATHHLDLIDDLSDKMEKSNSNSDENTEEKKKKSSLDIEDEAEFKEKAPVASEKEVAMLKKASQLDIEEEQEESIQKPTKETPQENLKSDKVAIDIENDDEEEQEESLEDMLEELKRNTQSAHLQLEDDEEEEQSDNTDDDYSENLNKKNKVTLDLTAEEDKLEDKENDESTSEAPYFAKKKTNLEIEEEDFYSENKMKKEKAARDAAQNRAELEVEDDSKKRERQAHQDSDYARRNSGFTEHIQEREGNKADAHSDKIQTHYDSRKSTKHGDDEWTGVEREQQFDDQWKRNKKNEFIMPEKAELGEQTIDYSDLKKQFDAIGYELGEKKKVGEFADSDSKVKPLGFASAIAGSQEVSEEQLEEAEDTGEENQEGPIQEATLGCSHILVRTLGLYLVQNNDRAQILNGILELLKNEMNVFVAIKYGSGPHDGKVKIETIDEWMDKDEKIDLLNKRQNSKDCPILPSYSDKTFEKKKTTFFYPYTEGITTFAWAECYLPTGTDEHQLKGIEAILESARGVLLDEFYELGGTGPYAKIEKKQQKEESKVKGFFGKLFGKKKAA